MAVSKTQPDAAQPRSANETPAKFATWSKRAEQLEEEIGHLND
jgi:hypothetical protein